MKDKDMRKENIEKAFEDEEITQLLDSLSDKLKKNCLFVMISYNIENSSGIQITNADGHYLKDILMMAANRVRIKDNET